MNHPLQRWVCFAMVVIVFSAALSAQSRRIEPVFVGRKQALVIGNAAYPGALLKNPVNDAVAMKSALIQVGFDVTMAQNLDLQQMEAAIDQFAASLTSQSFAFVYFSGHGVQVNFSNYLLPVDFNARSEADVKYKAYPATRLQEKLEESRARLRVLVLDACRNNPFRYNRDASSGLAGMSVNAEGTLIAFSTGDRNTADDNAAEANGLYTKQLINALQTPGLDLRNIFQTAKEETFAASKGRQNPSVYDNVIGAYYLIASPNARPQADGVPQLTGATVFRKTMVNQKDGQTYVWIPPGSFQMGCSPGDTECNVDEKPAHNETIASGFWMGRIAVTQAAYKRVTGRNPSGFKGESRPVETIDWGEAKSYCEAVGMRLPTEAEWEYAARAGTTGARYGDLNRIAWYGANSGGETHPVAGKDPNPWGLYDMLGNVGQWTADIHDEPYSRVVRGASLNDDPGHERVSWRLWTSPTYSNGLTGFRCAGELP